jgi:hypothetical protein
MTTTGNDSQPLNGVATAPAIKAVTSPPTIPEPGHTVILPDVAPADLSVQTVAPEPDPTPTVVAPSPTVVAPIAPVDENAIVVQAEGALPPSLKNIFVAVSALAVAVIGVLSTLNVGHWSTAQTALVTATTGAFLAFVASVTAHFWPGTAKEPVTIAASITALSASILALGEGFTWWTLSGAQIAALGSLVSTILGVGSALLARQQVSPVSTSGAATAAVVVPQVQAGAVV